MGDGVTARVQDIIAFDLDGGNRPALDGLDELALADVSHFGVDAHVYIGEPGSKGSDDFQLLVCSPSWFARYAETTPGWDHLTAEDDSSAPVAIGTGVWFMRRWDPALLRKELDRTCAEASGGPTWGVVASRIGRSIPWEFDYRYDADIDAGEGG